MAAGDTPLADGLVTRKTAPLVRTLAADELTAAADDEPGRRIAYIGG